MSMTAAQVWENSSAFRRPLKQEVTAVLLRSSRCDCSSESTKLDTCTPWLDVLLWSVRETQTTTVGSTHNAPDDQCWFNDVLETEDGHSKVGKHTRFYTQHHSVHTPSYY